METVKECEKSKNYSLKNILLLLLIVVLLSLTLSYFIFSKTFMGDIFTVSNRDIEEPINKYGYEQFIHTCDSLYESMNFKQVLKLNRDSVPEILQEIGVHTVIVSEENVLSGIITTGFYHQALVVNLGNEKLPANFKYQWEKREILKNIYLFSRSN